MTLEQLKKQLQGKETISFTLPNGDLVPAHFHVTEVGKVSKHFIDCGGTVREEVKASLQLWNENDYDHRLHPEKLIHIIELSQKAIGLGDEEIEVEYQGASILKFGLDYDGTSFLLTSKQTDCLAKDNCGVDEGCAVEKEAKPVELNSLILNNSCSPGSGCC